MFPLLKQHYLEIARYQDIPLDIDVDRYVAVESNGLLRMFIARAAGAITGYAVFVVSPNMHYRTSVQAIQDVLYIDPASRGFGRRFVEWCDQQLKAEGVQVVYQHVKLAADFGPMLAKIGYEHVENVWGRRL